MSAMPALARRYVTAVTAVGLVVTFVAVVDVCRAPAHSASLWILAAFAVVGEMVPIRVPFHGERQVVTLSTTCVFALLLLGQAELAILAQVIGSAAGDIVHSKPWWKTLFNLAQYSISVAAAAAVLGVVGQYRPDSPNAFAPTALLLMFLSGVTLYLVNNALIAIAIATSQGISLRVLLRNDVLFQAAVMFVLLSQAPLLVLAIDRAMGLLPLFLPAVAVAYRNSRVSVQRDHEALHDALTDLPNRTSFHREVRRQIESGVDQPVAVLLIELDDFREVNETLGHSIGDGLLIELGARLQSTLSDVGFVARLGGDEFVLAAPLRGGGVREVADRVDEIVAAPFELDGVAFRLRASIGAAVSPDHGCDPEVLLQRAEVAMYVAKEGGSRFQVYSPTIDRHDPRRLALIGELHDAIGSGQLVVHYQPVASLATGEVIAAEALVRWQHPEHGVVLPDEFISLAETTGDIDALTLYVAREAVAQCARWHQSGYDLRVAVNVSPRVLQTSFPQQLIELFLQSGLSPGSLSIEITESGAMNDIARALDVLGQLRDVGIPISLDDFGTGHSSLSHLSRLPVDEVKIDKSFVLAMLAGEDDDAIVSSTITLGHSLGLVVVAEGVESAAAWQALRTRGCDAAQGYYLSRPLPEAEFARWLAAGHWPVQTAGKSRSDEAWVNANS